MREAVRNVLLGEVPSLTLALHVGNPLPVLLNWLPATRRSRPSIYGLGQPQNETASTLL